MSKRKGEYLVLVKQNEIREPQRQDNVPASALMMTFVAPILGYSVAAMVIFFAPTSTSWHSILKLGAAIMLVASLPLYIWWHKSSMKKN